MQNLFNTLSFEIKKLEEHPKASSAGIGLAIFNVEKGLKILKKKHNLEYQIESLHINAKK